MHAVLPDVEQALFGKKPEPYIRHPFAAKGGRQGWNEVGWGRGRGRGRSRNSRPEQQARGDSTSIPKFLLIAYQQIYDSNTSGGLISNSWFLCGSGEGRQQEDPLHACTNCAKADISVVQTIKGALKCSHRNRQSRSCLPEASTSTARISTSQTRSNATWFRSSASIPATTNGMHIKHASDLKEELDLNYL